VHGGTIQVANPVGRGDDPRDFVLVGAGGATAAHITALAHEMGIDTIILPKLASGLCAFGQIISHVKYIDMGGRDRIAIRRSLDIRYRAPRFTQAVRHSGVGCSVRVAATWMSAAARQFCPLSLATNVLPRPENGLMLPERPSGQLESPH